MNSHPNTDNQITKKNTQMHKSIFQPLQKHPTILVSAVHVHYSIKLFNTQIYMDVIVNSNSFIFSCLQLI